MKTVVVTLSFAALAAAMPQRSYSIITAKPLPTTSCTRTICADYVNSCGKTYGGCFAACPGLTTPIFTPPPCTTKPSPTPVTTSCTRTICADYINSCGQLYGGCYAACPGLTTPVFTPPPCKSTTTTPSKTTTTCQTICVDAVNECGIKYGGCYCSGSPPPYTKPPCPTTATPTPTATPVQCGGLAGFQCPKGQICIDNPRSPCGIAVDCLGICVSGETCGGFTGKACSSKTDTCIDDPRDDCSPKTGGADCGGLCIPKAFA